MKKYLKEGTKLIVLVEQKVYLANNFNACQPSEKHTIKAGDIITYTKSNDWDKCYFEVEERHKLNGRKEFRVGCGNAHSQIDNGRFKIK